MSRKYKELHGLTNNLIGRGDSQQSSSAAVTVNIVSRGCRHKKRFEQRNALLLFHANGLFTHRAIDDDDDDEDDDDRNERSRNNNQDLKTVEKFVPLIRNIFERSDKTQTVQVLDFSTTTTTTTTTTNQKKALANDDLLLEKQAKRIQNTLKRFNATNAIAIAIGNDSAKVIKGLHMYDRMESAREIIVLDPLLGDKKTFEKSLLSAAACEENCMKVRVVLSAKGDLYNEERTLLENMSSFATMVKVHEEGTKLGEAIAEAIREREESESCEEAQTTTEKIDEWILETEKAANGVAELFVAKITFEHNRDNKQIEQMCVDCTHLFAPGALGNIVIDKVAEDDGDDEDEEDDERPPVVYLSRRPFDSQKLYKLLCEEYGNVSFTENDDDRDDDNNNNNNHNNKGLLASTMRSQGVVWVNSRPTTPLQWLHNTYYPVVHLYAVDEKPWLLVTDDDDDDDLVEVGVECENLSGDRRTHLVFEGLKTFEDAKKIRELLDSCLVSEEKKYNNDNLKLLLCGQVWESVSELMERCGVITEGRGGAGCLALQNFNNNNNAFANNIRINNNRKIEEERGKETTMKRDCVVMEEKLGGKVGVLVAEAFLKPTKQQGETKVFENSSKIGHFFPKMPCLNCGSPWWLGDGGWNSNCANCGEDDRCYGIDQMPLRLYRGKYNKFMKLLSLLALAQSS
jgi:hypothetical protein